MRNRIACLLSLVMCSAGICLPAQEQNHSISAVDVTGLNGQYLLSVSGSQITVHPIQLHTVMPNPGPGPGPGPGPVVTPPPNQTLTEAIKAAASAVPNYPEKDQHRRQIAVSYDFLAKSAGSMTAENARSAAMQFCYASIGNRHKEWEGWCAVVDTRLKAIPTPQAIASALQEIAMALTADLPLGDEPDYSQTFGVPTYGLTFQQLAELMKILLTLLVQYLQK